MRRSVIEEKERANEGSDRQTKGGGTEK